MLQADPAKREPGHHAYQNAGEYLDQQITLNLPGNFIQHPEGDFFLTQGGAGNSDQLAPEHITRNQHKIRQKQNHTELTGKPDRPFGSHPKVVFDIESGFLDLH